MTHLRTHLLLAALATLSAEPGWAQVPPGWFARGPGGLAPAYSMRVDSIAPHGGLASGLVESSSASGETFGTLMQTFKADLYRGQRVRLTAFIKTENATTGAGLWMRIEVPGDIVAGFDNMMTRPIAGTVGWKTYEVVLDVPKEADAIAFGLLLVGPGRAWVDDIQLTPVDTGTAPTNMLPGPQPMTSSRPISRTAEGATNLQFES